MDTTAAWNMWENGGTYNESTYVGMRELVNTIRSQNNSNLVFVDSLATGEDLNGVSVHLIGGGNVVYAIHPYFGAQHDNESAWNFWFGNITSSANVPVVADERGEYQSSTHGECITNAPSLVPQFLAYLKSLNVGVIAYGLYPGILIRGWNFTNPTAFDQASYTCPNTPFPNYDPNAQGVGALIVQYFDNQSRI